MNVARGLGAAAVAAAVLVPMAWASTASLRVDDEGAALLRVSIGARPERIETCVEQTDEELAKVAPQMRQRVVCEGTTARYRYVVMRDGRVIDSAIVRGGGLRHDRRLYVFREYPLAPGASNLSVRLDRVDTLQSRDDSRERREDRDSEDRDSDDRGERDSDSRDERERHERERRQAEAVPHELSVGVVATLREHEVVLVSYDQDQRRLVARRKP